MRQAFVPPDLTIVKPQLNDLKKEIAMMSEEELRNLKDDKSYLMSMILSQNECQTIQGQVDKVVSTARTMAETNT